MQDAVFTVVNAVLLRPLPYADPSTVVVLTEQTPQFPSLSVTRYNYDDWRARARSFSGLGAVRATNVTLTGSGEPERVPVKMVTASLLPLLGVAPASGRGFDEADDRPGAEGVALLSDGFARRRFPAGDAMGQWLRLDNQPYRVVGILPVKPCRPVGRTTTSWRATAPSRPRTCPRWVCHSGAGGSSTIATGRAPLPWS